MKHHVLLIGLVWPEPNSSAAGVRMLQLINSFLEKEYIVSFACAAARSAYSFPLEEIGVACYSIQLNDPSFDVFIKELAPTMVVFDRYIIEEQFGWRVSENCPNALRILDTEDLHCLRKARQKAVKENRDFSLEELLDEETAKREIASILRCDLTWIISSFEMQLLKNIFKIDERIVQYLPMWVDSKVNTPRSFHEKLHFAFIGNFLHDPNWDAVLYLKKTIWPPIRKQIPQAQLHIFGAYPSQKVWDLQNEKEGFIVKGRADSIASVFDTTRVFLAPLRFGAGVKGKLIESMVHGVPNVTTPIGAESMYETYAWNGFIEEHPDTFAARAVTLYTNQKEWELSVENGDKILQDLYQKNTTFIQKLEATYSELETHRKHNFLGSLLQYQTLQATKYMSKWIALKNSKE